MFVLEELENKNGKEEWVFYAQHPDRTFLEKMREFKRKPERYRIVDLRDFIHISR